MYQSLAQLDQVVTCSHAVAIFVPHTACVDLARPLHDELARWSTGTEPWSDNYASPDHSNELDDDKDKHKDDVANL